jgi:2-iminobutanoate/2-iminopropanoate deaminase
MTIQTLDIEGMTPRPYVAGLVAGGDLIFVSGQIPLRDGTIVDGPIEKQVDVVLDNIKAVLRQAGASLDDVVHCGVFVANLDDLPQVNAVYARAFTEKRPTRTTVGVQLPGYGVEIDCIAVVAAGSEVQRHLSN